MSSNSSTCGIITFEDDNSRMSIASNCSSVSASNNSESQANVSCETIERANLEEECNKRAYLDGTWFAPDFSKSTTGKVYGMCQICKSDHNKTCILTGSLYSSSNFKTHLKRAHSQRLAEFENYCLSKKQRCQNSQNKRKRTAYCDFSQKEFEQNIINYILDSFAPYNTVQQPSFRKIFDDMNIQKDGKQLHHLSTRTLVRKIEESYESKMTNIKDEISKASCVCTTADIWTSHSRRFMGVTVHWIDEKSLKRISYAIACRRFSGSHTHDRIANLLNEIHSKYDITREKLIATVTDNGSNFVKAFKKFGVHLDDSQLYEDYIGTCDEQDTQYEREFTEIVPFQEIVSPLLPTHQRCASHTLHLVATNDILREIKSLENIKLMYNDIMQKCSTLWKSAKSPKKYEIIIETLKVALKRPVVTRWNSLFDCFKQLIILKEKLLILFGKLDVSSLTTNDFIFIEEYVKCTEPIAEALDILQGDVEVSYGYLLPTIISARNKLQKLTNDELIYCKDLIPILMSSLETRFANLFNVMDEGRQAVVAAATHPKFKLRWLRCLSETAQSNAMIAIKNGIASCSTPSQHITEMDIDGNDGFDFDSIGDSAMTLQNTLETNASEIEFQRFCQDKKNDLSILHAYPIIKVAFIKFNTLIPSSAPVERMFSFATMFDIAKFNRLKDENFEKRVLCKANNICK